MTETTNLHDAFFKDLFTRIEVARDFLANHLPPDVSSALDLSALELVKDSFIDPELQSHFSDILYRVKLKGGGTGFVYILFEHKSWPEKFVALQLLTYMVRIWEMALREGAKKLPPIFPLVLYHGRVKWNVAKNFSALVNFGTNESLRPFAPEFEYYLFDTARYDEDKEEDDALLKIGLAALKYVFRSEAGEKLREYFKHFRRMPRDKALEFLDVLVRYLFGASAERVKLEDVRAGLKIGFSEQGAKKTMENWYQKWQREWEEKGLLQGRQEGRQEAAIEFALRLIQRRFGKVSNRKESQLRKLSVEKLEELGEALLDINKEKELNEWLRENDSSTVH
jgi:predicted transposase/invertase (TIGR01784 family)